MGQLRSVLTTVVISACTAADSPPPPEVQSITPSRGAISAAVAVEITGQGFYPRFESDLESSQIAADSTFTATLSQDSAVEALAEVTRVDEQRLTAVVPAGIAAGWWSLAVTGPFGTSDAVEDAYEAVACLADCPAANRAPIVGEPIADQTAPEETAFAFAIAAGTFVDPDAGDTLTLSAETLPTWLSWDAGAAELSGIPSHADVGPHPIEITARDDGEPSLSVSDSFVITVSGVPRITIEEPAALAQVQANVSLRGSCEVGPDIEVSGDLVAPVVGACAADATYELNVELSPPDGAKQVTVSQINAYGAGSAAVDLDRDTTPPSFSLLTDTVDWWNSLAESPVLSWAADDPEGNVATVAYAVGSGTDGVRVADIVDWTPTPADAFNVAGLSGLSEGATYYFNLSATDAAGNTGFANSDGWTVDVTPPTAVSSIDDGQSEYRSASVTPVISWVVDTADVTGGGVASGVSHLELAIGTGTSGAATSDAMDWTNVGAADSYWGRGLSLSDGVTYYANLRARDVAGNVSPLASSDGWLAVTFACPTTGGDFVRVPAHPEVDVHTDFCVAKYEMKAERDDTPAAVCCSTPSNCADQGYGTCTLCLNEGCGPNLNTDREDGCTWDIGTCVNSSIADRLPTCCHRAESRASDTPWVKLSELEAEAECAGIGPGFALLTNPQWMAMARNIETEPSNWLAGDVYGTTLSRGLTEGTVASAASSDDDPWFASAGSCSPPDASCWHQRRIHTLDSGEVIWDLGGNVYDIVADFQPISFASPVWISYNATDATNPFTVGGDWPAAAANRRLFAPANDDPAIWYGDLGGRFWPHDEAVPVASVARGGRWDGGSYGGIFCAYIGGVLPTSNGISDRGFRCAYTPP